MVSHVGKLAKGFRVTARKQERNGSQVMASGISGICRLSDILTKPPTSCHAPCVGFKTSVLVVVFVTCPDPSPGRARGCACYRVSQTPEPGERVARQKVSGGPRKIRFPPKGV